MGGWECGLRLLFKALGSGAAQDAMYPSDSLPCFVRKRWGRGQGWGRGRRAPLLQGSRAGFGQTGLLAPCFGTVAPSQAAISAISPSTSSPATLGAADVESSCHHLSLPRLERMCRSIRSAIDFPSLCSLHNFLGESFCLGPCKPAPKQAAPTATSGGARRDRGWRRRAQNRK